MKDDCGATMIEYALIVLGIAVVVSVAVVLFGVDLAAIYDGVMP